MNQTFVKMFFKPGENPIGHRFGPPGPNSSGDWEIVGVVEDTVYTSVKWKNHAMYFTPLMQSPRDHEHADRSEQRRVYRRDRA